jgi:hypothetical protein
VYTNTPDNSGFTNDRDALNATFLSPTINNSLGIVMELSGDTSGIEGKSL